VLAKSSMASRRSLCHRLLAVSLPAEYTLAASHRACRVTSKHEDRKRESIVVNSSDSLESCLLFGRFFLVIRVRMQRARPTISHSERCESS
jgi:hypothetical protein